MGHFYSFPRLRGDRGRRKPVRTQAGKGKVTGPKLGRTIRPDAAGRPVHERASVSNFLPRLSSGRGRI